MGACSCTKPGILSAKIDPLFVVRTEQLPPCALAIASTMARPSPTPPWVRERAGSARAKRSKMCASASGQVVGIALMSSTSWIGPCPFCSSRAGRARPDRAHSSATAAPCEDRPAGLRRVRDDRSRSFPRRRAHAVGRGRPARVATRSCAGGLGAGGSGGAPGRPRRFLENAVHYTERSDAIELRARANGSAIVIEVEDEGCGVDARDIRESSRRSARAPSPERRRVRPRRSRRWRSRDGFERSSTAIRRSGPRFRPS
jgi:hypothetical protein